MQPATVLLAGVPTSSTDVREKKASIKLGGKCGTEGFSEMPVIVLDGACLTQP